MNTTTNPNTRAPERDAEVANPHYNLERKLTETEQRLRAAESARDALAKELAALKGAE